MSRPPDDNSNASENYRPQFTSFLNSQHRNEKASKITVNTVSAMNNQMVREDIPMTRAHYEAATESISRGDTICGFLTSENKHVLDSKGNGCVYKMGKGFHHVVYQANKPVSEDTERLILDSFNPYQ